METIAWIVIFIPIAVFLIPLIALIVDIKESYQDED